MRKKIETDNLKKVVNENNEVEVKVNGTTILTVVNPDEDLLKEAEQDKNLELSEEEKTQLENWVTNELKDVDKENINGLIENLTKRLEALELENQELKNKRKINSLQEAEEILKKRKVIISNRNKFSDIQNNMQHFLLKDSKDDDDNFSYLHVSFMLNYDRSQVFTIANADIVEQITGFINGLINDKLVSLDMQLADLDF